MKLYIVRLYHYVKFVVTLKFISNNRQFIYDKSGRLIAVWGR